MNVAPKTTLAAGWMAQKNVNTTQKDSLDVVRDARRRMHVHAVDWCALVGELGGSQISAGGRRIMFIESGFSQLERAPYLLARRINDQPLEPRKDSGGST